MVYFSQSCMSHVLSNQVKITCIGRLLGFDAWVVEVLRITTAFEDNSIELISWWKYSILQHSLITLYNKVSIKQGL